MRIDSRPKCDSLSPAISEQIHKPKGSKRVIVTKTLPGQGWLDILTAADCRVEVCSAPDILSPLQVMTDVLGHPILPLRSRKGTSRSMALLTLEASTGRDNPTRRLAPETGDTHQPRYDCYHQHREALVKQAAVYKKPVLS